MHFSARLTRLRVSYMPMEADAAYPRAMCVPNQPSAWPWQASQLTPSSTLYEALCRSFGAYRLWQTTHRLLFDGGSVILRFFAITRERSFSSTSYALACLSFVCHCVYSVCRMPVLGALRGVALP